MGIEEYLYNVLGNQLGEIKYRYRERILNDIKNRMCSLLSRWNQEDFRRTILFVTDEEALFYEPAAPKDVKRFVVAAIRNSMLEVAASVNCNELKMREPLSDEKIRIITSSAICYFKECQFETLQEEARNLRYIDVYGKEIKKYPLAWTVLKRAAAANNSEEEFEKIQGANQRNIGEDFGINTCKTAICDGYSLEFDDYLKETLGDVVSGRAEIFYVDSFKGLTRNFEKILHVLQIVLQHENAFVTCNYYISNGRIEKRKKILRAFHSEKDMFDNMRNINGLPTFFRDVLLNMML